MGFFDKIKKTAPAEMSLPDLFKQWLDSVLRNDIPSDVVALCFNIYENENSGKNAGGCLSICNGSF